MDKSPITRDQMICGGNTFSRSLFSSFLDAPTPLAQTVHATTQQPLYFTFSPSLVAQIRENMDAYRRDFECAVKYGFRGYSTGEQNGIFLLRRQDRGLHKQLDITTATRAHEISDVLFGDTSSQSIAQLMQLDRVKIVTHRTDAKRVVGFYNTHGSMMYFSDIAKY